MSISSTPPPPNELPQPGALIAGKYRVERVLGVGGMGVVVAAKHVDLDDRVAIKFLAPSIPPHGEPVARFLREARAASRIKSDHVVRVFDVGRKDDGAPFLVMEYLEGEDLARLVERRGPLPIAEAIGYVLQACEAIAAAHATGIVHRDLKPANLFLTTAADGSARVKVLDFGISKIARPEPGDTGVVRGGLTTTATIMGTPCFMSPEQLRSTRDVDGRADVWSLGAILYALATGAPPYDGESNADVSAKIIRDDPPPLREARPDAPPALEAIVKKCLEKDAARRYQDVAELAEALGLAGGGDAQATAVRVARVAAAVAPTMRSHDAPQVAPAASDGPTRTASAWGETKPEETTSARRRAVPIAIAGAIAVAVAIAWATGVGRSAPPAASSAQAAAPAPQPAPPPSMMPATAAPAAAPTEPPIASASASASPPAPARPTPAIATTRAAPKPAASTPKAPGLFDDRE